MANTKPLLEAAFVCENLIIDNQGIASAIRIIDNIEVQVPHALPRGTQTGFPLTLFVRVKAGEDKVSGRVGLEVRKPDGLHGGKIETELVSLEPMRGYQFKIESNILAPQTGFYWFDFSWNDQPLTSVSLQVKIKPVQELVETLRPNVPTS